MRTSVKTLFLVPALVAGLCLIPAGRVTAQTFTNFYSFTATHTNSSHVYTNSDGAYPSAGLILSGNTLCGTAGNGGNAYDGTLFAVTTDGTSFTTLHTFTNSPDGGSPHAGLILAGNTLHGTARGWRHQWYWHGVQSFVADAAPGRHSVWNKCCPEVGNECPRVHLAIGHEPGFNELEHRYSATDRCQHEQRGNECHLRHTAVLPIKSVEPIS